MYLLSNSILVGNQNKIVLAFVYLDKVQTIKVRTKYFRLKPQYYQAIVGTNQLRAGGKAYKIRKAVQHESYDDDIIVNDIAILFTEQEIEFSSTVDAIELNDEPVEKGEDLILTGWGTTSVSIHKLKHNCKTKV